ncbi:MAG: hypothetical protein ACPGJS_23025 [Flammeovirgaceae bacterium]
MAKQANDKKFEEIFKQRLGGYEEAPPPMAWEQITPQIGKNGWPHWRYLLPLFVFFIGIGVWVSLSEQGAGKQQTTNQARQHTTEEVLTLNKEKETKHPISDAYNHINHQTNKGNVGENRLKDGVEDKHDHAHAQKVGNITNNLSSEVKNPSGTNTNHTQGTTKQHGKSSHTDVNVAPKDALSESAYTMNGSGFRLGKGHVLTDKMISLAGKMPNLITGIYADLPEVKGLEKSAKQSPLKPKSSNELFFFAEPVYTYERVYTNSSDGILVESGANNPSFTGQNLGVKLGLGVRHALANKRVALFGNVEYSLLRKEGNFKLTSAHPTAYHTYFDSAGVLHISPLFKPEQVKARASYHLLGVRLGADFLPFASKPNQRIVVGGGFDALLASRLTVEGNGDMALQLNEKRYIHPVGLLGYELTHTLSDRLTMKVMPNVTYYFSSLLDRSSTIGSKPYTVGLRVTFSLNSSSNLNK